jgi:hypothetical protein
MTRDSCRSGRVLHLGCVGFTDHPLSRREDCARWYEAAPMPLGSSDGIGSDNDVQRFGELHRQGPDSCSP